MSSKQKLFIAILAFALLAQAAFAVEPPSGLVGHYQLNTGSGNVAENNIAGKANGVLNGSSWVAGYTGAYSVNVGSLRNPFTVSDSVGWDNATNLCIAFWSNVANTTTSFLWSKNSNPSSGNLYAYYSASTSDIRFNTGEGSQWATGVNIRAGGWNHYTFVVNTTHRCVYINATANCQAHVLGHNNSADQLSIGSDSIGDFPGNGYTFDDVRLYNRSCTTAEISAMFNSGIGDEYAGYSGVVPQINQSTYNMTSNGGCTVWRANTSNSCNTTDTTPTLRFNTTASAYCAIGITNSNYTSLVFGNNQRNCTTTGATGHVCTLPSGDSLGAGTNYVYVGCKSNPGGDESSSSASGQLALYVTTQEIGEAALDTGIANSAAQQATIYTNQQVYVRTASNQQALANFDRVVVLRNQRWAFEYTGSNETPIGTFYNLTPVFYYLELTNATSGQVENSVKALIDSTIQ